LAITAPDFIERASSTKNEIGNLIDGKIDMHLLPAARSEEQAVSNIIFDFKAAFQGPTSDLELTLRHNSRAPHRVQILRGVRGALHIFA
jgi:hypothetical protein